MYKIEKYLKNDRISLILLYLTLECNLLISIISNGLDKNQTDIF